MINIILADDHQMFIDGLKSVIKEKDNINVVGEASNGKEVFEILNTNKVDVVILDIEMPEMDGIEAAKKISVEYPFTKVLILTMYNKKQFILNLMQIGVAGYILKSRGKDELVKAIHWISNGESYFGGDILKTATLIEKESQRQKTTVLFTSREKDVLRLLGECKTSKEMAEELYVAPSTVETHIRNLLSKLDMPNRLYLVRYAVENGFVKEEE